LLPISALVVHNPPDGRETFKLKGVEVMRRQSIAIAGMIILTLALATVAMAADPFVGTWKLNVAKSQFSPGPPPKSMITTIDVQGAMLRSRGEVVQADGTVTKIDATEYLDGKDHHADLRVSVDLDTDIGTRIDSRTIVRLQTKNGLTVNDYRSVVSEDGKTLTRTVKGITRQGQERKDVLVLERQ
jgi:hypothetical protein